MRVFQSTYKDRKSGQTKATAKWYVEFSDHMGVRRRMPAFTDKKASQSLGRNIEKLVRFKFSGEVPDEPTTRWIESMNPKLQRNLAKIGLLDAGRVAAMLPLIQHLNGTDDAPGFRQYLASKGNTPGHVERMCNCLTKAFEGSKAVFWSELSSTRLMTWLNSQRTETNDHRGLGACAINRYIVVLGGFAKWMLRERRATENPMLGLHKLNPRTDKRHERRALTVDEIRWLLDTTRQGPTLYGMSGVERALIYRLAIETGLRLAELQSLTRASFNLDGANPAVTVRAAYSKRRRDDTLPLRTNTAAEICSLMSTKLPTARAFALPANRRHTIAAWKADLAAARNAWLSDATTQQELQRREESYFLCYVDSAGRFADFHALRHTAGSLLAASGAHPKVAQSMMRHSSIDLTMSRYSHVFAGQEADAVAALPNLADSPARQSARATGTDNAKAVQNSPASFMGNKSSPGRHSGSTGKNFGRKSKRRKHRGEKRRFALGALLGASGRKNAYSGEFRRTEN